MAHVCEDDGSATTFVAALPPALRAPITAPQQWPAGTRAVDTVGAAAPRLDRTDHRPAERLKPAA